MSGENKIITVEYVFHSSTLFLSELYVIQSCGQVHFTVLSFVDV